jgi:hypothetical protein
MSTVEVLESLPAYKKDVLAQKFVDLYKDPNAVCVHHDRQPFRINAPPPSLPHMSEIPTYLFTK